MVLSKIKEHRRAIQREFAEKTAGYILAALGLVAGLAWNEAIKSFIAIFFPMPGNDVIPKFIYAVFVTVIIVIVSYYLLKFTQKKS